MTVEKRSRSIEPASDRIGVLVLGMHRSGTSALTRVLSLLGCDLPNTLMNANESNEAGHWESHAVMKLNDQILQSAGSNWHDWLEFNPGWYSSPKAAEFKEKALAVLESEYGRSGLLVLKDPRICRFAPFWIDVLETAGLQPAIVTEVRNPLEVAGSLCRRDGFDPAMGHLLWLRHMLDAESGSRGRHRFHSSYDGLLNGWPQLVSDMQDVLKLSWPRLSAITGEEIDNFLTQNLRHHVETSDRVLGNPMLSGWLRESFAIFSRWAKDGESDVDHATLDRIRGELNDAAPAFAQLVLSGHQRTKDLKAAQQRVEEQGKELASLEAEHAALAELGATLEGDLRSVRVELEDSRRVLSEAQTAFTQSKSDLDRIRGELSQNKSELDSVRGELSQTQSALAQRSAEAEEVTAQLHAERNQAATRHEEIAALSRLLQEREADLTAAQRRVSELDQARTEEEVRANRLAGEIAEERRRSSAEIEGERRRSSAELEKLRAEKGMVEGRLAERFSEIAAMTRMLAEKETAVKVSEDQLAWLRDVSSTLLSHSTPQTFKARLASLMSAPTSLKKHKARLKRNGYFDAEAYLAAYPDVAGAGLDPLWHYIVHGLAEGRTFQSTLPVAERKK